ncbi:MAG: glycosyltransferase [Chitinispirillaceae bacterium]|nr:glycosyltransferase [Chitinispirillaceae bacterium]
MTQITIISIHFLLIAISCVYAGLVGVLIFGVLRPAKRQPGNDAGISGISIVIPFRNEARNLPRLIESINNQSYDKPVEVILVNDCSSDNYDHTINTVPSKFPLTVIDLHYSNDSPLTSKQQALDTGIRASAYDWIALTDADMQLAPHWLSSLAAGAAPDIAMVFGHTIKRSDKRQTLFSWFQSFQLEALFSVAHAFVRTGLPGSCMGNNLLIAKNSYHSVGGHSGIGHSIVEDCDLLAAFWKHRLRVTATRPFAPSATTDPCSGLVDYLQQLLRWAYGGFRKNKALIVSGIALIIQNTLFIALLFNLLSGTLTLIVLANLLLTWLFIIVSFKTIRSKESPLLFWPYYLFLLLEMVVIVPALVFRPAIAWKGRPL